MLLDSLARSSSLSPQEVVEAERAHEQRIVDERLKSQAHILVNVGPREQDRVADGCGQVAEYKEQRLVEEHALELAIGVDIVIASVRLSLDMQEVDHVDAQDEQESGQRAHEHAGERANAAVKFGVRRVQAIGKR